MGILLLLLLSWYYRLDTATEEGFRHLEYYDTKIPIFENAGLFQIRSHICPYKTTHLLLE